MSQCSKVKQCKMPPIMMNDIKLNISVAGHVGISSYIYHLVVYSELRQQNDSLVRLKTRNWDADTIPSKD